jgi:hypothetical protein
MPATVTLAQLRTRALQRVDMVNSGLVTTAEVNQLINVAGARLHDLLVCAYEDYYQTTTTFSLTAGKEYYDLISDLSLVDGSGNPTFYKMLEIFLTFGSGATLSRYKLRKFNTNEIGLLNNPQLTPAYTIMPIVYWRLEGQRLYLEPIPTSTPAGFNCELWYAPQYVQLINDGDLIDYGVVFGWDEFIVNDVAINLRLKEESDISGLLARQQDFERKLEAAAQGRDISEPGRVQDVERTNWNTPFYAYR